MTVFLISIALYLAGWVWGTRDYLRFSLENPRCTIYRDRDHSFCRTHHAAACWSPPTYRTLGMITTAMGVGLIWPFMLVAKGVSRTVPPTPREMQQRIDEQAAEIDRLTRELGR